MTSTALHHAARYGLYQAVLRFIPWRYLSPWHVLPPCVHRFAGAARRLRSLHCLLILCTCFATLPAHAHKPSDSYLSLNAAGDTVEGQWDIALRDLEAAIGLDGDGDGELTWGEVRARHDAIAGYALSRLKIGSGGEQCVLRPTSHLLDHHTDGAYAVLRFVGECPAGTSRLDIEYSLLFDIDPQHKGLLKVRQGDANAGADSSAIFSHDARSRQLDAAGAGIAAPFLEYLKHGVWHIWIGFDHILFLVSLLLPAVLVRRHARWEATSSMKGSAIDVLKVVTAFTVAHSITLTLAALEAVELPSRWVESVIAASVVVAALNNLFPVFPGKRWVAAFVFGLIHGFGFASVLGDLGLPSSALLVALVGFNVGVELGQLAIVLVFLPIAFALRQTLFYRRVVFHAGSLAIAVLASFWFAERAFDMKLIPV